MYNIDPLLAQPLTIILLTYTSFVKYNFLACMNDTANTYKILHPHIVTTYRLRRRTDVNASK